MDLRLDLPQVIELNDSIIHTNLPAKFEARTISCRVPAALHAVPAFLCTPAASPNSVAPNPAESATIHRYPAIVLLAVAAAGIDTSPSHVSTLHRIPPRPGSTAITSHSRLPPASADCEVA